MENTSRRILSSVLGAASGAGGLAASTACGGGACLSCFGCAAVGLGVLLAAFVGRAGSTRQKGGNNAAAVVVRQEGDSYGMA